MSNEQRLVKLLQGFMDLAVDASAGGFKVPKKVNRMFVKSYRTLEKMGYEKN